MKIYLLYLTVPYMIFQERLKYLMKSVDKLNFKLKDDDVIILYAWTPKKKLLKRFLEERCMDVFTVKTREFDFSEDYEEFEKDNLSIMLQVSKLGLIPACDGYETANNLSDNDIVDNNHFAEMVVTKSEIDNACLFGSENMNEFGPVAYADMDYTIFNDDIIAALKVLGYVTLYDSTYSQYLTCNDERARKFEEAMDVINLLDVDSDYITPLIKTPYVIFIYLYSYTFIGR